MGGRCRRRWPNRPAQVPVAYDVDVVVVGGGTGAVSAAVAAAESGAKVFLAAPYPYLGDDMTATLRLWLEPGETPTSTLGKLIFADRAEPDVQPNTLPFTYKTDVESAGTHKDTNPPGKLCDGLYGNAPKYSVQYNSDVTVTCTLKQADEIKEIRLLAYHRESTTTGGGGFSVAGVDVATSDDGKQWKDLGAMKVVSKQDENLSLSIPAGVKTRYVKLLVEKPANAERILLDEVQFVSTIAPAAAGATPRAAADARREDARRGALEGRRYVSLLVLADGCAG